MSSVAFERVLKCYGAVTAVDGLTLDIEDGEFLVLVGPSGSGQTTALRMLAGLETITDGAIRIGDRVVNRVPPRDRDIAMVFQDYALYPQMTVRDNLAFGLRRRKLPKDDIAARVRTAADALELEPLLDRRPRELSGGQQQRVALGRALVREPQVFLMDEPLSNLDAKLRAQTRGEIKRLQHQVGTTTLYVTHDQVEAMTMGDRIAVMQGGRLEQVGTPRAVYDEPANVFVAGFIGSPPMSLAPFNAFVDGGVLRLRHAALELEVPTTREQFPTEVIAGVRPEHVHHGDDAALLGPLEGRVTYSEALGRETFAGVALADSLEVVLRLEGHSAILPGDTLRLGIEPGSIHLFDARTGDKLGIAASHTATGARVT